MLNFIIIDAFDCYYSSFNHQKYVIKIFYILLKLKFSIYIPLNKKIYKKIKTI